MCLFFLMTFTIHWQLVGLAGLRWLAGFFWFALVGSVLVRSRFWSACVSVRVAACGPLHFQFNRPLRQLISGQFPLSATSATSIARPNARRTFASSAAQRALGLAERRLHGEGEGGGQEEQGGGFRTTPGEEGRGH